MQLPSDAGREPVSSYVQALGWLFSYGRAYEWLFDEQSTLPPEARLVCDIFWLNESNLRRDLKKLWGAV